MTTVLNAARARVHEHAAGTSRAVRIALLGLGNVGSAIAELASHQPIAPYRLSIASALVRDVGRRRPVDTTNISLTSDPHQVLASAPDVVVEVLGGLEPARSVVLTALSQGIPVVTANKSLLATHGDELFAASAASGTTLLYEASVMAGVPFLGTFHRRPIARGVMGIAGIVNGTSNYILSRMAAERMPFADALREAQRAGYAEPDPSKDVDGHDAVEKLCVLLRHFGGWSVAPAAIDTAGIRDVELDDLDHAAAFGGSVRPVVAADWDSDRLAACAGPAFVYASNQLARVIGVQNAVSLKTKWSGDLFFSGPGAGPTVTAATVLDDVAEAQLMSSEPLRVVRRPTACETPETGWFIRLTSPEPTAEQDGPALLTSLGVRMRRISQRMITGGRRKQWLLTHSCGRRHVAAALDVLCAKTGSAAWFIRAIE